MKKLVKVLVIEDDERIGDQLVGLVVGQGWLCRWCLTGGEGLTQTEHYEPEVIILDLGLPDCSGLDVLARLRGTVTTPIVIVSATINPKVRVQTLEMGADDYITKPFWDQELFARLRAVLRRRLPNEGLRTIYKCGDLTLNSDTLEVYLEGELCQLTPSEFTLLQQMLKRPNQAFSCSQFLDLLGKSEDVTMESVQAHISRLRKKLRSHGNRIKTVWGIGYKFDAQ